MSTESAIEHEIVQAQRRHATGELTRASMAVVQHLLSRLAEERTSPSTSSPDGDQPDVWGKGDLDTQRRWLAQIVNQVVVAKTTRAGHAPFVNSGRLTIHYKDGDIRQPTRPEITLADVGRQAGCNRETAGRALKGTGKMAPETRARVRTAAEELGYELSRPKNCDLTP